MYKRLISVDEESDNILKQQPAKKASKFVRDAIKLKAKTLSTDEPAPKPEERKIPTVRITI